MTAAAYDGFRRGAQTGRGIGYPATPSKLERRREVQAIGRKQDRRRLRTEMESLPRCTSMVELSAGSVQSEEG